MSGPKSGLCWLNNQISLPSAGCHPQVSSIWTKQWNSDETVGRCMRGFILFQCSYFYADVLIYIHVTWATLFIGLIPYFYFICGIWSHLIYILFVHFLILTCYYHVPLPFSISIYLCFLNVCFPKFVVITCGQPIWENIKKKRNEEKGHTRQIILWLTICYCYKTDEKLEKWFIKCTFIFVWP